MDGPASPPPRHGLDVARERDALICRLLGGHPATSAMLVSLGWFGSRSKARKRLRRLVTRRRIRLVGTVSRKGGRPEHVYCVWRPKGDQLLHEVELTELCLRLHAGAIFRGPHVRDEELRPDAEVWIKGALYYLELDRATSGYDRIVSRRFALYRGRRQLSLWVCPSPARREGLRHRAAPLRSTALFTTLDEVMADPHGAIWVDHQGARAALPRHTDVGRKVGLIPGPKGRSDGGTYDPPASG